MLSSLTVGFSTVCGDPFTLLLIFGPFDGRWRQYGSLCAALRGPFGRR